MPRRFVDYEEHRWTIPALAREHHLASSTLYHRLERFPATATGVYRALATGVMECRAAGRRGALKSPWRFPD